MAAPETLPEGTDTIVPGASAADTPDDTSFDIESASGATPDADAGYDGGDDGDDEPFRQKTVSDHIEGFKAQAGDKARDYATQGRDRLVEQIEGVVQMIEDAARQIDDKVGAQYGDYARQGAQTLAGFSSQIQGKDIDELFDDARALVAKSPGIAIATAATIGFVLARLARAGAEGVAEAASGNEAA